MVRKKAPVKKRNAVEKTTADQLDDRQKLAAHYYLNDPERIRGDAYRKAYETPGKKLTKNGAATGASRLFRNPAFATYLAQLMEQTHRKLQITEEDILLEWTKIGLLDPGEAYDEDGKFLPIKKMPIHVRKAIASIDMDEDGNVSKVKFVSKNDALNSLGRHFGLFKKIKEIRLLWMDGASALEKLERRQYIEAEMVKRGILPAPIEEKDVTEEVELVPDDAIIN